MIFKVPMKQFRFSIVPKILKYSKWSEIEYLKSPVSQIGNKR